VLGLANEYSSISGIGVPDRHHVLQTAIP